MSDAPERIFIAQRKDGSMSPIWWRKEPDQRRTKDKVSYRAYVLADENDDALLAEAQEQ